MILNMRHSLHPSTILTIRDDQILGAHEKVNAYAFTQFIAACQFPFGGIAKAPGQPPGP